ncbi:MAG: Cation diffusion facilitator family transporter [Pedosphaera sp.]|nr:Cation diffusion facilitator family transporter [Pedosphaera sp.]
MHSHNISRWQHSHDFCGEFLTAEKNTRRVLLLTAAMMVVEIIGGLKLHSMALFADGWHMATHVTAFLITVLAYALARRHAKNDAYSFGTGKIAVLGAFTSAIILGGIALFMAGESVLRLLHPLPIHFNEAIGVACVGLAVNVASALMLKDHPHPGHDHHGHDHGHSHGHSHDHDLNLKAAYIHVLADAVTSLLAIIALTGGKIFGWVWLDPAMGIVGSVVITQWAYTLVRDTNVILLDKQPDNTDLDVEIRKAIETDSDTVITDLHIWQVGVNKFAAIISLVAHHPQSPEAYKALLKEHEELVHATVEVHRCELEESLA